MTSIQPSTLARGRSVSAAASFLVGGSAFISAGVLPELLVELGGETNR